MITFLKSIFNPKKILVLDFNKEASAKNWTVVNDSVMGGVSSSEMKLDEKGKGVFEGEVSIENNGGFTLIKKYLSIKFTKEYSKIELRVKGDGKQYQFRIKSNLEENYWYIQKFTTENDWDVISLPLASFYPSQRGNRLSLENFNANQIEAIAFLIGNKKQEEFKLIIDTITLT